MNTISPYIPIEMDDFRFVLYLLATTVDNFPAAAIVVGLFMGNDEQIDFPLLR